MVPDRHAAMARLASRRRRQGVLGAAAEREMGEAERDAFELAVREYDRMYERLTAERR